MGGGGGAEQNRWRGGGSGWGGEELGRGGCGSMLMPVYREISHCDPITVSVQGRALLMQRVLLLLCKLSCLSCEVRTPTASRLSLRRGGHVSHGAPGGGKASIYQSYLP